MKLEDMSIEQLRDLAKRQESELMQAQEVAQAQAPVLPRTPEEAVAFIGPHFGSMDVEGPLESRQVRLSIHDLLSSFSDWQYFPPDAAPQQHAQPSALMVFDGDSTDQPVVEATAERLLKSRQIHPKNAQAALSDEQRSTIEQAANALEYHDNKFVAERLRAIFATK